MNNPSQEAKVATTDLLRDCLTIPWTLQEEIEEAFARFEALIRADAYEQAAKGKFRIGERVTKTKGSNWTGRVVGTYSTSLTPEGYAIESENEPGSVQIYPVTAIRTLSEQSAKTRQDQGDATGRQA